MKNFFKDKKVVVTGAGGFIGTHMVDLLVRRGARVTACLSKKSKSVHHIRGASYKKVDLMDTKSCHRLLSGQDMVMHFAGMDGGIVFKREHNSEIFRVNTGMAHNILEAAKENKLKRVLMISSIEIYPQRAASPITEDKGHTGDPKADIWGYAWSKRQMEITSGIYYELHHLPVAIARLGNVYGPGDDPKKQRVIPIFIRNIASGKPIHIYDKHAKVAFLHIGDLVRTLLDLTEKYAVGDPVNIVGEQAVSIEKLINLISSILGKKAKVSTVAIRPGEKRNMSTSKAKKVLQFHEDITLFAGLQELIKL